MDQISSISGASAAPYLSARARARMWWLTIHRWLGLATLIPMAILGITGSLQVWPEETEALLNPERAVAASADPARLDETHVAAARAALAPHGPIQSLRIGGEGEPLVAIASVPADGPGRPERHTAWIDPENAQVIDTASSSTDFMRIVHVLHGSFLIPDWGRQAVGWMGLLLTISALTGLWVFWPGKARFVAALKWNRHEGKNINLHRQSGVLLSLVIVVEAVTGAWICFPAFFAGIVEPGVEQPERRRPGGGGGEPLAVEDAGWIIALDRAQRIYPGRPTQIEAPTSQNAAWSVEIANAGMTGKLAIPTGEEPVTVEEEAARTGPPPAATRAGEVASTMRGLHYATIGGFIWQVLVFLSGIALSFLALSGGYIWAKRKLRRRA